MTATIKDVAALAGTSTATVSKVMNKSYSISQETIDRVHRAMEELDYHPNLRARNFAIKSTKTVVFITTLGEHVGFANPHMFEMMSGMEQALSVREYSLIVKNIEKENACAYIREVIDTKLVDGIIIHASVISKELDQLIYEESIPHIVIGIPSFSNHFCWIDIDNRLAGELAAKHVLEIGCQRITFIGGTEEDKISTHRLEGVLTVLNNRDLILPIDHVKRGESDCDSGYHMTEEVLDLKNRPDAIICANNYIAYGCMHALLDRGVKIPEEICVLTFDDYPFSQILKPKLTVVNIDLFDVGIQAGKQMLRKIKKPNLYFQSYVTLPSLVIRESTQK